MFTELCDTVRTVELDQLHRFAEDWEAVAEIGFWRDTTPNAKETYDWFVNKVAFFIDAQTTKQLDHRLTVRCWLYTSKSAVFGNDWGTNSTIRPHPPIDGREVVEFESSAATVPPVMKKDRGAFEARIVGSPGSRASTFQCRLTGSTTSVSK